jgi:hypothetical protein
MQGNTVYSKYVSYYLLFIILLLYFTIIKPYCNLSTMLLCQYIIGISISISIKLGLLPQDKMSTIWYYNVAPSEENRLP